MATAVRTAYRPYQTYHAVEAEKEIFNARVESFAEAVKNDLSTSPDYPG